MSITHAKVSAKSDGGDSSLVLPSDWNADHVGNNLSWFNVVDDGATGDGVTDDTAAVQAAIDAAEAASGGVVFFPAGTYVLAGVTVDSDNVLLVGSGPATKLIPAGASDDLVTFLNVDYWGIRDFRMDGAWNGSRGIVLLGARWGTVLNIVGDAFSGPLLDMRADGAATQNVNNNLIQHVHAENATKFIRLLGDSGNFVTLNVFEQISAVGAATVASTLLDLAAYCDTNKFGFVRFGLNYAGSIGIILNSDSAASTREVYGNLFDEVAIDQDAAGTVNIQANNTDTAAGGVWPNVFEHIRIGGANPTDPVIAGANTYVGIGHPLGSIPTASLPAATGQIAGTQVWDRTTGTPKWSSGSAWVEGALSTHDHDLDYEAAGAVSTHAGAADPHAGYVKEADLDTLIVWADEMLGAGGSTANNNVNRWMVKGFDLTTIEYASKMVQVPAHWATFDVAVLWANGGAGSGDVVWGAGISIAGAAAAESLTAASFTDVAAVAAGAQNAVLSTAILTAQSASSLKRLLLVIRRKADDVADTLGNDANLVAAVLTKAS